MTDTAVDVQQLLLFSVNACVYPPAPPPGYIPASLTGGFEKSPGQVMLAWPPHLKALWTHRSLPGWLSAWGNYRWAGPFWKLALGEKVGGLALAVVTGWLQAFEKAKGKPCPLAPAHISLPLNWASRLSHPGPCIFCRKNCWTLFLYR